MFGINVADFYTGGMVVKRNRHGDVSYLTQAEYHKDDNKDHKRGGATDGEGQPLSWRRNHHERTAVQFKGRPASTS